MIVQRARSLLSKRSFLKALTYRTITSAQASSQAEDENIIQENWERRCELATAYRALEM